MLNKLLVQHKLHKTQAVMPLTQLLLHKLQPSDDDIIGGANHDEIYLSIDLEKLAAVISEEQIIDLLRCGVQYDRQIDGLMMFV